jgi:prophage regulatory protein
MQSDTNPKTASSALKAWVSQESASALSAAEATKTRPRRAASRQPIEAASVPDALLKIQTAGDIGGLSISTIYRKAASDPTFPKLVRIGARCTRIRAGDFMAWLAAQSAK